MNEGWLSKRRIRPAFICFEESRYFALANRLESIIRLPWGSRFSTVDLNLPSLVSEV